VGGKKIVLINYIVATGQN